MAASLSDSNFLGVNLLFIARVQASLLAAAVAIFAEGTSVNNHRDRVQFIHLLLASPTNVANFSNLFALTVSTDATVVSQATQVGTVVLSAANAAAQQALVTDTAINNAVAGQFNAFVQGIAA